MAEAAAIVGISPPDVSGFDSEAFNVSGGDTDEFTVTGLDEIRYGGEVHAVDRFLSDFSYKVAGSSEIAEQVSPDLAANLLFSMEASLLVSVAFGLDYALELRKNELLISSERQPDLMMFLIGIAGDRHHGLKRETGHVGYHFHYARLEGKRTNVMLTFNPDPPPIDPEPLYWELHGAGTPARPWEYGRARRRAIYDSAKPSLLKIGKAHFRHPSAEARVLYP